VDDEKSILGTLRLIFERDGYEVVTAPEALVLNLTAGQIRCCYHRFERGKGGYRPGRGACGQRVEAKTGDPGFYRLCQRVKHAGKLLRLMPTI
jgi:hypothetical protein